MMRPGWRLISRDELRAAEDDLRRCVGHKHDARLLEEAPLLMGLMLEPSLMMAIRDDRLTIMRAELDNIFARLRKSGWRYWGARPLLLDRLLAPAPVEAGGR